MPMGLNVAVTPAAAALTVAAVFSDAAMELCRKSL